MALEIPDSISDTLQMKWNDLPRRALEALAADAYRDNALTAHQVGQLLGHSSRWQTEAFLKEVHAYFNYTENDLEEDARAIRGNAQE